MWAAGALHWGLTPDSPQQPSPFGLGVPASPYRSPLHSTAHLGPFRPGVAQPLSGRRPCRCCTAGHGKVHVWCSAVWCGGATLVGVEGTVSFFCTEVVLGATRRWTLACGRSLLLRSAEQSPILSPLEEWLAAMMGLPTDVPEERGAFDEFEPKKIMNFEGPFAKMCFWACVPGSWAGFETSRVSRL